MDRFPWCCRSVRLPSRAGKGLLLSPNITSAFSISALWISAFMILASVNSGAQNLKSTPKANASPAGDAVRGKLIYSSHGCYECHGGQGQGSTLSGPRVGPDPVPFPVFLAYLRQPAGQMPPYSTKIISDADLANIYAFLASLPKPASAQSIRLLNREKKTLK